MRVGRALLAQERLDPRVQGLLDHAGGEPLERAAQPLLHELAGSADALDFGGVLLDAQAHHERAGGGDLEAVALGRARARVGGGSPPTPTFLAPASASVSSGIPSDSAPYEIRSSRCGAPSIWPRSSAGTIPAERS